MLEADAIKLFKCLADKSRLQILKSLVKEEMYVERLAERLDLTPATISFHLKKLEDAGAAAVGFNCVAADMMTPYLVSKLRRSVKGPLICKPNAGVPIIGEDNLPHYPMAPGEFGTIMKDCAKMGATLLGGCCGTTPEHIAAI